jgi:predicted Zn-dependent protease
MNLYRWGSRALAEWFDGDIIVMAESIEEARQKAMNSATQLLSPQTAKRMRDDVCTEPDIVGSHVIFIRGAD